MAYVYRDGRTKRRSWVIAYVGPDGRWHREATDAPDKKSAKLLLAKRMVQVVEARVAGVTFQLRSITFEVFAREYLSHVDATLTPSSARGAHTVVQKLCSVFGGRELMTISTGMIQRYLDQRRQTVSDHTRRLLRPATVNRELTCLSAMFREALKRGYVLRNPARGIPQVPEDNQIVRYLTRDEEARLLAAANPDLRTVIVCALHTGMRKGEILGLTWDDVDLDLKLIRLQVTKSHRTRSIPINAILEHALRALPRHPSSNFVFVDAATGSRFDDRKTAWAGALRRSGIEKFRFHDLRHSFASRLVQAGVPINVVQELLGHSTMQLTLRYAHMAPGYLRAAVDALVDPPESPAHAATERGTPPEQIGIRAAEDHGNGHAIPLLRLQSGREVGGHGLPQALRPRGGP